VRAPARRSASGRPTDMPDASGRFKGIVVPTLPWLRKLPAPDSGRVDRVDYGPDALPPHGVWGHPAPKPRD